MDGNQGATEVNLEQQQSCDDGGQDGDKKVGPWKRMDGDSAQEDVPVVEKKPEPAPVKPPSGVTGAYVAPSRRESSQQQTHIQPSRMRSKVAPDIHNEEFFPTLSKTSDNRKWVE